MIDAISDIAVGKSGNTKGKRNELMYYEGTNKLADGHFEHHYEEGSLHCEYSPKEGKYNGACTFFLVKEKYC